MKLELMITKQYRKYYKNATERMYDENIVPLFSHFSDMGIAPMILAKKDENFIETQIIEGVELDDILLYLASKGKPDEEKYAKICDDYGFFSENTKIENVIDVYRQLGSSIAYISKCGIVHRDLHPGNVVVEGKNKPYIIDWESVCFADEMNPQPCSDFDLEKLLRSTANTLGGNFRIPNPTNLVKKIDSACYEFFVKETAAPLDRALTEWRKNSNRLPF
jgi:tRNA A-37 threonylcarbamoyl transferase component Bud32